LHPNSSMPQPEEDDGEQLFCRRALSMYRLNLKAAVEARSWKIAILVHILSRLIGVAAAPRLTSS
jgi:hypothetical protein